MKTISTLVLLSAFAASAGCESAARPPELVSARTAYDRAAQGPAASLNPTDLHTAKKSLDTAEQSFQNDGDTQATRDLAYTAQRRTETAEARARTMKAVAEKNQIVAQMNAGMAAKLASANQTVTAQGQALQLQSAALQTETARRQQAEKAAAELAKVASVKQEARGMVITLSGSVLFASGKADLVPAAKGKLDEVAKALTEQDPDSKMIIEGHTDSQGSAASNQDLSQKRAQSVREYLVSHGIAGDRVTATGFGSTRSIADNATTEGRANNRRVEIVVQPKQ
jgi:outer membrane protein OmpA-like peptidoglycan-associated protein